MKTERLIYGFRGVVTCGTSGVTLRTLKSNCGCGAFQEGLCTDNSLPRAVKYAGRDGENVRGQLGLLGSYKNGQVCEWRVVEHAGGGVTCAVNHL